MNIIYSAHHAGTDFGEWSNRTALDEELQIRLSDFGTAETAPQNGILTLIAKYSRGLVDLNRAPNDPSRFPKTTSQGDNPKEIWLPGQTPSLEEQIDIDAGVYQPYHQALASALAQTDKDPALVVAWDNAGHYDIGRDIKGQPVTMPPVILSNRGAEGSGADLPNSPASCDSKLLQVLARNLQKQLRNHGLPNHVFLNLVFRGGYICEHYNTKRHTQDLASIGIAGEVQSLQVEYDGSMVCDQKTFIQAPEKAAALKSAFEVAFNTAYETYFA